MNLKNSYIAHQLISILSDNKAYKIQVTSDQGKTKWLNIDHKQLEKIADILIEGQINE